MRSPKKKKKRSSPKLRLIFRPKSEIQRFFPSEIRWSPKKRKVFTEIETDFPAEIRNSKVFSVQNQVVSNKKKRSSPKLRPIFRPKSEIQRFFSSKIKWSPITNNKKKVFTEIETDFPAKFRISNVWGGLFSYGGGLFSIFNYKSASKAPKTCDFAYFTSQWGGARAPPAPLGYATECKLFGVFRKVRHSRKIFSSKLKLWSILVFAWVKDVMEMI